MHGVDVGAAVKQELDDPACRTQNGPVQRRTAGTVATLQKRCIVVEKLADTLDIVGLRSHVDWMIPGRCNSSPAFASLLKKRCDAFMTTVPGHLDETAIVISIPLRVSACFEKDLYSLDMPFAHREVNRLGIPVFRLAPIALLNLLISSLIAFSSSLPAPHRSFHVFGV
jgi:hypothetical protein